MYICENCFKEYDEGYDICPHCGYVRGSGKRENYIKLANNFMLPNKYLNEKIVQVSVQKLLSIF